jgi:hypothetical protein
LRDIVLARSEKEVCRQMVLRIPVSENLRLQIAQQALETDAGNENSTMPRTSGVPWRLLLTTADQRSLRNDCDRLRLAATQRHGVSAALETIA